MERNKQAELIYSQRVKQTHTKFETGQRKGVIVDHHMHSISGNGKYAGQNSYLNCDFITDFLHNIIPSKPKNKNKIHTYINYITNGTNKQSLE